MSLRAISLAVSEYAAVTLYPLGFALNAASFAIYSRPAMNKTNMGFLNKWQVCVDNLVLVGCIFTFRTSLFSAQFYHYNYSDFACRTLTLFRRFILHASSFMSSYVVFDRFMSIHFSGRFKWLRNRRAVSLAISLMFLVVLLLDVENALFYLATSVVAVRNANGTIIANTTSSLCTATQDVRLASDMISITLRTYVPYLIMVTFNSFIIRDLLVSKRRAQISINKREIQFAFTVVLQSTLFLVFNFPLSVGFVFQYTLMTYTSDTDTLAALTFYMNMSATFSFWYQALSFFITIVINKLFYRELVSVLLRRPAAVENATMTMMHSKMDVPLNNTISTGRVSSIVPKQRA